MDIAPFLQNASSYLSLNSKNYKRVICFCGAQYPLIFFTFFSRYIINLERINLSFTPFDQLIALLETQFLGQDKIYFLGDISILDKRTKEQLFTYLAAYQGPHMILLFNNEEKHTVYSFFEIVIVSQSISYQAMTQLIFFLPDNWQKSLIPMVKKIVKSKQHFNLEQAILILYYSSVVGRTLDQFFTAWFPLIYIQDSSLFSLCQYFFSRNSKQFFILWHQLAPSFPETFWITYFSEQTWRAYYYIQLQEQGHILEAKKISYRLPFSFIQKDWRHVNCNELLAAHHFLYTADRSIKTSTGHGYIDLFLAKFLSKGFFI